MGDETDNTNASILGGPKKYLGPYEFWNFKTGRHYAFPAIRRGYRYLTALVEYPDETELPSRSDARHIPGDGSRSWVPTLWGRFSEEKSKEESKEKFLFLPIVVENPAGPELNLETLVDLLYYAFPPPLGADGDPRFRVAFPVDRTTMNAEIDGEPDDPEWDPDEEVRNRIGIPEGRRINVLAVIDDGIPFAHRNFRSADGRRTRIEFCWLQSAEHGDEGQSSSVLFGREYTRECINHLIEQYGDDEDELYRHAGALEMQYERGAAVRRLSTHGAHVMDIAGGFDPNTCRQPPEETRLIAVQLPNTTAWDTSGFGKDMYLLSAVHYVLERAERIGEGYGEDNIRVVINFSYGFSGGRHDGESELEAAIDELIHKRRKCGKPTAIVMPSGNTFVDRMHAVIRQNDLESGEFSFDWRIQPNDRTPSYLEIWFPHCFDAKGFQVSITAPFGQFSSYVTVEADSSQTSGDPRNVRTISEGNNGPIGQISADFHRNLNRWRVLIVLAPSEPEGDRLLAAPAGKWTVTVKRESNWNPLREPIRCWIQRDSDPDVTRNGRRQSYFDHPDYEIFNDKGTIKQTDEADGFVRRFGTVNGLATGKKSLIVAGFKASAENTWDICHPIPATYSSAGLPPSKDEPCEKADDSSSQEQSQTDGCHRKRNRRERVDCSSLSDRSNVLPGTIAAGTRSGALSQLQGTSAAAPVITRKLAEAFTVATDDEISEAESGNYRRLLDGTATPNDPPEWKVRLGKKLVFPDSPNPHHRRDC